MSWVNMSVSAILLVQTKPSMTAPTNGIDSLNSTAGLEIASFFPNLERFTYEYEACFSDMWGR